MPGDLRPADVHAEAARDGEPVDLPRPGGVERVEQTDRVRAEVADRIRPGMLPARWTMSLTSWRSPRARNASRSVTSRDSTVTRPSRNDGTSVLRFAVTTTSCPRSASARAVWAPIMPSPPVTRIVVTPAHRGRRAPRIPRQILSDGGRDSLDRAGADVADGEQAGDGRCEGALGRHKSLGSSSTPASRSHAVRGRGADHQEQSPGLESDVLLPVLVSPRELGQTLLAAGRRQVGPGVDGDPVVVGEPFAR